jgi:hypothetical protein
MNLGKQKNEPTRERQPKHKKEDFVNGGKYCHLFIPKNNCVSTQIVIEHVLTADRASPNVYNLWRQFYAMRQAAA